jgi:hypothetical protein
MATVYFGSIGGAVTALGVAEIATGYLPLGLICIGVAALIGIICALVRLNWRILGTNQDLIAMNEQLLAERRAELLRRLHEQGWD